MWNLKHWTKEEHQERLRKAQDLFVYSCELAEQQNRLGKGFVIEHPATASSWSMQCAVDLASKPNCRFTVFDQCAVGLVAPNGEPMKKRTRFLSNLNSVDTRFRAQQCHCEVPHRTIQGNVQGIRLSVWSQRYPPGLCNLLVEAAAATAAGE